MNSRIASAALASIFIFSTAPTSGQNFGALPFLDLPRNYENCASGAQRRLERLGQLIDELRPVTADQVETALRRVHRFFYRHIRSKTDSTIWSQEDYWATPAETLCAGDGDSEDFAIATYFTLAAAGMPESRLRLVYARRIDTVPLITLVVYRPEGGTLVADYREILELEDIQAEELLSPVYAFNTDGFWLANERWYMSLVNGPDRIEQWQRILVQTGRKDGPAQGPG